MSKRRPRRAEGPPAGPSAPAAPGPSGARLLLFAAFTALVIPLLLLALVEGGLRLAGVGFRPEFTLPCEVGGKAAFCENPDFALRFFPPALARRPLAFAFPAEKGPRTVRIFVVGESAAQGDPEPAFGVSRFLEVMLRARLPDLRFEVVNTGVVAVNSHVLLPIVRDVARRDPDVLVVYAGNNEVVGPFGAGTVFGGATSGLPVIRLSLAIRTTRLGQVLDRLTRGSSPQASPRTWRGMEMFLAQQVRASDPAMARVYAAFERNLTDLVAAARGAGARVVLSTVATRLGDFAPFGSLHRDGLSPGALHAWDDALARGRAHEEAGRLPEAIAAYREAAAIDGEHAELAYRLARCLRAAGDLDAARAGFERARDLDTLRFRADGRENAVVRRVAAAAGPGVALVDAVAALGAASSDGIPAGDLFHEHAHPTPEGNHALAAALFPAVVASLPDALRPATVPPTLPFEDCARALALTGFDRYRVAKEVLRRVTRPPFTGQLDHDVQVRELVAARDRGAEEPFEASEARYREAVTARPDDPWLLLDQGILYDTRDVYLARRGEPDRGRALAPYGHALELLPRLLDARVRLAEALIRLGRPDEAIAQCRTLLGQRPRHAAAWATLGFALARQGKEPDAMNAYERALDLDPSSATAHLELGALLAARGDAAGAARHFAEAAALRPEEFAAHWNLSRALELSGRMAEAADAAREGAARLREAGRGDEAARLDERARQLGAGGGR